MADTRSIIAPALFAGDATTSIPPSPIAGVSYRNPATTPAYVRAGWPFAVKVDSAAFNQVMYQITGLLGLVDSSGLLGWSSQVNYGVPAMVFGSDGNVYLSTAASGPANGGASDPLAGPGAGRWTSLADRLGSDVGQIAMFATLAPAGRWMALNGAQNVSRTAYAGLFAVVGTTFGSGDGSTTFGIPEVRGEFLRSLDMGRGVDPSRSIGSFQADMFRAHNHSLSGGGTSEEGPYPDTNSQTIQDTVYTSTEGGPETRPRNVAFPVFIRY